MTPTTVTTTPTSTSTEPSTDTGSPDSAAARPPSTGAAYSLGHTDAEYDRLQRQAMVWQAATERVLDRVAPTPGARCLDAGCGPGVTMRQLAQRVGPQGRVVGIDSDERIGRLAVEHLHAEGHHQCEFRTHDLRDDAAMPGGPYDVVYARLVLFHLPDRVTVLRRLWDAVAPGGALVVQDYDLAVVSAVPSLASVDGVGQVILDAFTLAGCEVRAGSLLPRLFTNAGIAEPDGTDVAGRLDPIRVAGRMLEDVFTSLLPVSLAHGLVTRPEADERLRRLREDIATDPTHQVLWPLLMAAWKRKVA